MSEESKIAIHWAVSKLVIVAVPLLNQLLFALGITVTTSPSTADNIANFLCIGVGLAYSYWVKQHAKDVHTTQGFSQGISAALGDTPVVDPAKTVTTVLEIPFNKPADSTKPDAIDK